LARARGLLAAFEAAAPARAASPATAQKQLDLFRSPAAQKHESEVLASLRGIEPDRLTGLAALQFLHQLKKLLGG
jgi:DNA mismatch repair ATPase MutS